MKKFFIYFLITFLIIYLFKSYFNKLIAGSTSNLPINSLYSEQTNSCLDIAQAAQTLSEFKSSFIKRTFDINYKSIFTNYINQELINLTNNDFDNLSEQDDNSIYYYLKPNNIIGGMSNNNKLHNILVTFKTKINNKFDEFKMQLNQKMSGGSVDKLIGMCFMIKKLYKNKSTVKIFKDYVNKDTVSVLDNLSKVYDDFINKINLIIDDSNLKSSITTSEQLNQLLNNLYIYESTFSLDNFIYYYNNHATILSEISALPPNYKYAFNLDYVKSSFTIQNNNTNSKYPPNYKYNDNYFNFILRTNNTLTYNSALYIDSQEAYILYKPDSNIPKARTMFEESSTNKSFIKLNNFIFQIKDIIYNSTEHIRFNIKLDNFKINLFNIDTLKNLKYYQIEFRNIIKDELTTGLSILPQSNHKGYIYSHLMYNSELHTNTSIFKESYSNHDNILEFILEFLLNYTLYNDLYKDVYKNVSTNKQAKSFYDNIYYIHPMLTTDYPLSSYAGEINDAKYRTIKSVFSEQYYAKWYSYHPNTIPLNKGIIKWDADINSHIFNKNEPVVLGMFHYMIGLQDLQRYVDKSHEDTNITLFKNYFKLDRYEPFWKYGGRVNTTNTKFHQFIMKHAPRNFSQFYLYETDYIKYILDLFNSNNQLGFFYDKSTATNEEKTHKIECAKRVFNLLLDKTKIKKLSINLLRVFKTTSFKRKEKYNLDNPSINNNIYENIQKGYDSPKLEMFEIISSLFKKHDDDVYEYDTLIDKIIDSPELIIELNELKELTSFLKDFSEICDNYFKIKIDTSNNYEIKFRDLITRKTDSVCVDYVATSYLILLQQIWFADTDLTNKILDPINDYLNPSTPKFTDDDKKNKYLYLSAYSRRLQINLIVNDVPENLISLYNKYSSSNRQNNTQKKFELVNPDGPNLLKYKNNNYDPTNTYFVNETNVSELHKKEFKLTINQRGGNLCNTNPTQVILDFKEKLNNTPMIDFSSFIKQFINYKNEQLLLILPQFNINNLKNRNVIYYWLNQPTINQSNELYSIIKNLKTNITQKYNELSTQLEQFSGGSSELNKRLCNIIKYIDTSTHNLNAINIVNKKKYKKTLTSVFNNFDNIMNQIIDTSTEKSKINNNKKLEDLLNSMYDKDVSINNFKIKYNDSGLESDNELPSNYILSKFHLEYNRDLIFSTSNTNKLERVISTNSNQKYPNDYKVDNNYYNFYLRTNNLINTKCNAAIYYNSNTLEYYIIYIPSVEIDFKRKTMLNSDNIPHKQYIKLNNYKFKIKNIVYDTTYKIIFNIDIRNSSEELLNFDILKTELYLKQYNNYKINYIKILQKTANDLDIVWEDYVNTTVPNPSIYTPHNGRFADNTSPEGSTWIVGGYRGKGRSPQIGHPNIPMLNKTEFNNENSDYKDLITNIYDSNFSENIKSYRKFENSSIEIEKDLENLPGRNTSKLLDKDTELTRIGLEHYPGGYRADPSNGLKIRFIYGNTQGDIRENKFTDDPDVIHYDDRSLYITPHALFIRDSYYLTKTNPIYFIPTRPTGSGQKKNIVFKFNKYLAISSFDLSIYTYKKNITYSLYYYDEIDNTWKKIIEVLQNSQPYAKFGYFTTARMSFRKEYYNLDSTNPLNTEQLRMYNKKTSHGHTYWGNGSNQYLDNIDNEYYLDSNIGRITRGSDLWNYIDSFKFGDGGELPDYNKYCNKTFMTNVVNTEQRIYSAYNKALRIDSTTKRLLCLDEPADSLCKCTGLFTSNGYNIGGGYAEGEFDEDIPREPFLRLRFPQKYDSYQYAYITSHNHRDGISNSRSIYNYIDGRERKNMNTKSSFIKYFKRQERFSQFYRIEYSDTYSSNPIIKSLNMKGIIPRQEPSF